jgi:hypothetical protein
MLYMDEASFFLTHIYYRDGINFGFGRTQSKKKYWEGII